MRGQSYFGLGVLFVINAINFADRLSITAILSEIKTYYHVQDKEASALAPAFLAGYMFTAPIFGHFGDRYSRKWIVIGGIAFWCFACASALLFGPDHFHLFVISRALVGVGEASYSTIAPTLIGDLFPPSIRKIALSIFFFAIPIGTGFGFLIGYIALTYKKWQLIFIITPTIGAITIALLLFFKEPKRGEADAGPTSLDLKDTSSLNERIHYLYGIKSYVWSTIGFTCCIFTMGAISWHAVEFMTTAIQGDKDKISLTFGIIVCVAGLAGVITGSSIAQFLRPIDGRADPLVCAFGVLAGIPLTFFGLVLAKSLPTMSWILLFFSVTALSTNWAIISEIVLSVTIPNKRAFASACQILISHMFGDALSPFIVGALKDSFDQSIDDKFHSYLYSLVPTLIVLALGVPCYLYSSRFYVQDVENCKEATHRERIEREETVRSDEANLTDFAALP